MAQTQLSVTIQDSVGVKATSNLNLTIAGGATFDGVGSAFNDYLPLLNAITDGEIVTARLVWEIDLPGGMKTVPVAKSIVQRGLLQQWIQANLPNAHPATIVPAIASAIISATTGKFDVTNAAYLAWRAFLLGWNTGDVQFKSPANNQITGSLSVLETFRKHRRRTAELTKEVAP